MAVIRQSVFQLIFFEQKIKTSPIRIYYNDPVFLTDNIHSNFIPLKVSDKLTFTETINYRYAKHTVTISDFLVLKDKASRSPWLTVSQFLPLTDSIGFANHYTISQSLNLVQTIERYILPRLIISQQLSLTQTFIVVVNFPNPNSPSSGSGGLNTSCLDQATSVAFIYGTFTMLLPPPEYGNAIGLNNRKVQVRSRGSDLILFRDPLWSKEKNIKMTFNNLIDQEKDTLKLFLNNTCSNIIGFTDLNRVTWAGIVTNQPTFTQENNCLWRTEVDFQVYN